MSFIKYIELYARMLPYMTIYPVIVGTDIGLTVNKIKPDENSMDKYASLIGFTSLGIITGITYPISYPLLGTYVLYKHF